MMSEKRKLIKNETINSTDGTSINRHRTSHKHFYHEKRRLKIDFVLAAKNVSQSTEMTDKERENDIRRRKYFHNLRKQRLKISKRFFSGDSKTVFWHVHAPFDVLADTAEDMNIRIPTVQNDIEVHVWYERFLKKITAWWNKIDPFLIQNSYFPNPKSYFADIFDKNRLSEYYPVHMGGDKNDIFSNTERSRLVSYILESTRFEDSSERIGKANLIDLGVLTAAYPCHDGPLATDRRKEPDNDRQKLAKEWATFRKIFKYQPLQGICDYFGVKIAFYYAWIGFYTTWLVPTSFIGILFFFFGCLSNLWFQPVKDICSENKPFYMCPLCDKLCNYYFLNKSCVYATLTHCFDNDGTPIFAVLMSIWSVFYLEYWKRKEWSLAYEWHTMDFKEEEVVRPQYTASAKKFRTNPVTGKIEPTTSKRGYWIKITGEASVVIFFIGLVIGALFGVIIYRAIIFGVLLATGANFRENSKLIVTGTAAFINLIVINVLKLIYRKLALMMTEWENPRTRSSYEKSFTVKMFWFQFCNTFSSVFYVAFFKNGMFVGWPGQYTRFGPNKNRIEGCSEQGCFLELCVQLVILMAGQQLVGNIVEIVWPLMQKKYNTWKNEISGAGKISVWEEDYQLAEQEELSLFWEYQEVVLQYGFVTMFVAAFPLAPLVALITNIVEIRIDAINMVRTFRRPVAYKSQGIGVWYDILVTLTTVAVLINGFVIALTSEFIPRLVYKNRYSQDGSLNGYVDWSLASFHVKNFQENEKPDTAHNYPNINQSICRFPGFHKAHDPYPYSEVHWYIMTIRLMFAFLFQWFVSGIGRVLAWVIPDRPQTLDLKIKRQEYLSKEALKKYKLKTGKRQADEESTEEDEDSVRLSRGMKSSVDGVEIKDISVNGVQFTEISIDDCQTDKTQKLIKGKVPDNNVFKPSNRYATLPKVSTKGSSERTNSWTKGDSKRYTQEYLSQML